ncbi:hypothetical protein [Paenibacillus sp. CMAA1364]
MSNSFANVFAAIIAIALLLIWPVSSALNKQDDVSEVIVLHSITQFVDSVRDKGYITPTMYTVFEEQMALTGNSYDIQMVHRHKRYDPVYNDDGVFQDEFNVHYEEFFNADIHKRIFPNDSNEPVDSADRVYTFTMGDLFDVTVKNTNRTLGTLMNDFLTAGIHNPNERIVIPYGGMVLNEDYY